MKENKKMIIVLIFFVVLFSLITFGIYNVELSGESYVVRTQL